VCLYSCLSYPASKTHASYYIVICGPSGFYVFLYILLNSTILVWWLGIWDIKCGVLFCINFTFGNISHSKNNSAKYKYKYIHILKRFYIYNFIKCRAVGAEWFHVDGQTGRQTYGRTDMTKLTVAWNNLWTPVPIARLHNVWQESCLWCNHISSPTSTAQSCATEK
jgi:hypothetical protein